MQEPLCKKCRGILEHRPVESNIWICTQCGCQHIYSEPPMTEEQRRVEELRSRMNAYAGRLKDDLAGFTASLEAIRVEAATYKLSTECIAQILQTAHQSDELLWVSRKGAEEVIEELRGSVTPVGGGHFEVLEDLIN